MREKAIEIFKMLFFTESSKGFISLNFWKIILSIYFAYNGNFHRNRKKVQAP